MANLAGMMEQERLRAGSVFQLELVTGTPAGDRDPETGFRKLDVEGAPASVEGLRDVTILVTNERGTVYPAVGSQEFERRPEGTVTEDDQILLYGPGLDLSESATRRTTVVWQGKRYDVQDIDLYTMENQGMYRRALLKLRAGQTP